MSPLPISVITGMHSMVRSAIAAVTAVIAAAAIIGFPFKAAADGINRNAMGCDSVQSVSVGPLPEDSVLSVRVVPSADFQSVGLVLSGGGAKGIAHVGVIQALEENDIPIDYVAGTSMGAIVGGLYSIGYTPAEMMRIFTSKGFSYWSTGQDDPELEYMLSRVKTTPKILTFPISRKDSLEKANGPAQSLISPIQMSFAYMTIFAPYTAQCKGDFNRLFVPYRAVASDVSARKSVVLDHGDLAKCIRASMSFPAVFPPTQVDSMQLYDGGIFDNYPFRVMRRDFAPSFMLGSNVSTSSVNPNTTIVNQMENLIMMKQNYTMPPDEGMTIQFNINRFGLLNFGLAPQIYETGYRQAMDMMDSIKSRIHTRMPRASRDLRRDVFKSQTPYLRFDSVRVTGGTKNQNEYLTYLFSNPQSADTFGVEHARLAYYRALSSGRIRAFEPVAVYNDTTGMFRLDIKADIKDNLALDLGGYVTSSNNNFLYVGADYSTLSFHSLGTSLGAWLGQNYLAADLSARLFLKTSWPSFLSVQGAVSRQKFYENEYLFYEDKLPAFITESEYYGKLRWSFAAGRLWRLDIGLGAGHIFNSFYDDNSSVSYFNGKDKVRYTLGMAFADIETNTLSDINYPLSGHRYIFSVKAVKGRYRLHRFTDGEAEGLNRHPKWLQLGIKTSNYFPFGRHFVLGLESDILLSTRKLLGTYTSSLVSAPGYNPTPASNHSFNPAFRANSYLAGGLVPVYRYNDNISARLNLFGFLPMRKIKHDPLTDKPCYGRWLSNPVFFGELDVVYSFPMVSLAAYCNYTSYPARNWNVGIAVGVYLHAPKFLR